MDTMEKLDRLAEAVAALLEGAPGHRLNTTNLNKALFYLDLVALRDTGAMITRASYVAFRQGPVVDDYKRTLLPALENMGIAQQDKVGMDKPVVLKTAPTSYHYLDDHLRARAADVAAFVARKTASQISHLSHENPGWKIAWERGQKQEKSAVPINMYIAMQQVADRDPWLDEPADEAMKEAFAAADHQTGSDF